MPITVGQDTAKTRKTLTAGGSSVAYYSIAAAEAAGLGDFSRLPVSLKVVLENLLRFEDGKTVTTDDIRAFSDWAAQGGRNPREIAYRPARGADAGFHRRARGGRSRRHARRYRGAGGRCDQGSTRSTPWTS